MKTRYLTYRYISLAVTVLSVILGLLLPTNSGYELLWLVPAIYFILSLSTLRLHSYYRKSPPLILLDIFLFIKYAAVPLMILTTQDFSAAGYTGVIPVPSSIHGAILFELAEMAGIFTILHTFVPVFYKKRDLHTQGIGSKRIMVNPMVASIAIVSFGLAVLFREFFVPSSLLVLPEDYSATITNVAFAGLIIMIAQAVKLVATGVIVNELMYRYRMSPKMRYVLISYITILLYAILSTGTSRTGVIVPFLIFVVLTYPVFKRRSLIVLAVTVPILAAGFISISAYKANWIVQAANHDTTTVAVINSIVRQSQEYTANIRPTALGIESVEKYKDNITPGLFVNDILGSIPSLSSDVDQSKRINVYYNDYILNMGTQNTSLIMPLSTISAAYFGTFGVWIIPTICILLLLLVGRKWGSSTSFPEAYLQAYLVYVLAFGIFSNTQMLVGRFVTIYLPTAALLYLVMKFNKRQVSTV